MQAALSLPRNISNINFSTVCRNDHNVLLFYLVAGNGWTAFVFVPYKKQNKWLLKEKELGQALTLVPHPHPSAPLPSPSIKTLIGQSVSAVDDGGPGLRLLAAGHSLIDPRQSSFAACPQNDWTSRRSSGVLYRHGGSANVISLLQGLFFFHTFSASEMT